MASQGIGFRCEATATVDRGKQRGFVINADVECYGPDGQLKWRDTIVPQEVLFGIEAPPPVLAVDPELVIQVSTAQVEG